jgi:hypothetical protein
VLKKMRNISNNLIAFALAAVLAPYHQAAAAPAAGDVIIMRSVS